MVIQLMLLGLCFPLPMLALLGAMNQRRQLAVDRRKLALIHRIAKGRGRK